MAQAERMVDGWGFGVAQAQGRRVAAPTEECAAVEALREAFPDLPLRLDPNGAWTPETSDRGRRAARGRRRVPRGPDPRDRGDGVRRRAHRRPAGDEHVRDRVRAPGARDRRRTPCRSCSPTTTCGAGCAGRRCSAASPRPSAWACPCTATPTSGVSLAAMVHLAAATPNLTYACDTHYPWKTQDVVVARRAGVRRRLASRVPDRPGPRRRARPRPARTSCTSSTSPAAFAAARTPPTCGRSIRRSPQHGALVSRPGRHDWSRRRVLPRCTRMAARAVSGSPAMTAAATLSCSRRTRRRAWRRSGRTPRAAGCAAA